jgi:hypothetical protein
MTHKASSRLTYRGSSVFSGSTLTVEKDLITEGRDKGIAFLAIDKPGFGVSRMARVVSTKGAGQK